MLLFWKNKKTVPCWNCDLASLKIVIMRQYFSFAIERIHSLGSSYLSGSCLFSIIELVLNVFTCMRINHLEGIPIISWKYASFNFSEPKSIFKHFCFKKFADMVLYRLIDINIQKRLSCIPSIPYFNWNEVSSCNFLFSL